MNKTTMRNITEGFFSAKNPGQKKIMPNNLYIDSIHVEDPLYNYDGKLSFIGNDTEKIVGMCCIDSKNAPDGMPRFYLYNISKYYTEMESIKFSRISYGDNCKQVDGNMHAYEDAINDFNGKENTMAIMNSIKRSDSYNFEAVMSCKNYSIDESISAYIPAFGEFIKAYEICTDFRKYLGAIATSSIWTSTLHSAYGINDDMTYIYVQEAPLGGMRYWLGNYDEFHSLQLFYKFNVNDF